MDLERNLVSALPSQTTAPLNWTTTADCILDKLLRLCSQISGMAN